MGVAGSTKGPIPALVGVEGEAFKDYDLLRADDTAVRAMMLNFRQLSSRVVRGQYYPGKLDKKTGTVGRGSYDARKARLNRLELLRKESPGPETHDEAVTEAFKLLLEREPNEEELSRYRDFLASLIEQSDPHTGWYCNVHMEGHSSFVFFLVSALLHCPL